MPAQPLNQARDCRDGTCEDHGCEFRKRPHEDWLRGPGPVCCQSEVDAVDQADDARDAGTIFMDFISVALPMARSSEEEPTKARYQIRRKWSFSSSTLSAASRPQRLAGKVSRNRLQC